MRTRTCPSCRGSRKDFMQPSQPCPECGGRGWLYDEGKNKPVDSPRRRLTSKDVISVLILIAVIIGIILYIFSQ